MVDSLYKLDFCIDFVMFFDNTFLIKVTYPIGYFKAFMPQLFLPLQLFHADEQFLVLHFGVLD